MAEKIVAYRTRDSGIYGSKDRLYDTERECLYQEAEADKVAAYNKLAAAKEELLRSLDTYTHTNWLEWCHPSNTTPTRPEFREAAASFYAAFCAHSAASKAAHELGNQRTKGPSMMADRKIEDCRNPWPEHRPKKDAR